MEDKYKITEDRRSFWPNFVKDRMIENEKWFGVYDKKWVMSVDGEWILDDWPLRDRLPKDDEDIVD